MPSFLIWLGLVPAVGLIALSRGRRPVRDAWPAYAFSLLLAPHIRSLFLSLTGPRSESVHDVALVLQQVVTTAFLALLVVLFAARRSVTGPHATLTQGVVALVGTFCLYLVGFLPVESSTSTESLLASSAVVLLGMAFAIWSLATLGGCFGIMPEVRGLVLRGPYRLVRHPVYLGEIVAALGLLLTRPHLLTLALLATFVLFQYWRTIFEERALGAAYPNDYSSYRAGVPRLVPGWR
jgi:protein-S-isoprenylcysteine O-methyltransferase Ste14